MKLGMRTIKKESCHIYHTTPIQNVPSLGPVPLGKLLCMTLKFLSAIRARRSSINQKTP